MNHNREREAHVSKETASQIVETVKWRANGWKVFQLAKQEDSPYGTFAMGRGPRLIIVSIDCDDDYLKALAIEDLRPDHFKVVNLQFRVPIEDPGGVDKLCGWVLDLPKARGWQHGLGDSG